MGERIRGFIHVHSDFSRDGLCSVGELAEFANAAGYQFVGLTDHAEDLSPEDGEALRQECEKHSGDALVMIPGLEFRCTGDVHILGIGITHRIPHTDPILVASEILKREALAILAHPGRIGYRCPPGLWGVLNGIEVWNASYDGRFVPPPGALRLLREARRSNPTVCGFGGADLHGLYRPPGVELELYVTGDHCLNSASLLQCLRLGQFAVRGRYVWLDPKTPPGPLVDISLWGFRKIYEVSKATRDKVMGIA